MNRSTLDSLFIATPCSASWDEMRGDDRVRECSLCSKDVFNISGMTKKEAEDLLNSSGLKPCMTFFRRADGTIITDDCPMGLRKLRDGVKLLTRAAATVFSFIISITCASGRDASNTERTASDRLLPKAVDPNTVVLMRGAGVPYPAWRLEKAMHEACQRSESIVVCEYVGYESASEISFVHPPHAQYRTLRILKGPALSTELLVRYDFKSSAATVQPPAWKFSESFMPKKGEQFILFLVSASPWIGIYETCDGAFGRLSADPTNIEMLNGMINYRPALLGVGSGI